MGGGGAEQQHQQQHPNGARRSAAVASGSGGGGSQPTQEEVDPCEAKIAAIVKTVVCFYVVVHSVMHHPAVFSYPPACSVSTTKTGDLFSLPCGLAYPVVHSHFLSSQILSLFAC